MKLAKLSILMLTVLLLTGCCGPKEAMRGFLGISTKVLEDNREGAIKREFNSDIASMHGKVKDILKAEGAYIYKDDLKQNLIALYVSEADTTPVGVFFTDVDGKSTRIEISSPSTYGKETIAGIIFGSLDGTRKPKDKKGKEDAEKKPFWNR